MLDSSVFLFVLENGFWTGTPRRRIWFRVRFGLIAVWLRNFMGKLISENFILYELFTLEQEDVFWARMVDLIISLLITLSDPSLLSEKFHSFNSRSYIIIYILSSVERKISIHTNCCLVNKINLYWIRWFDLLNRCRHGYSIYLRQKSWSSLFLGNQHTREKVELIIVLQCYYYNVKEIIIVNNLDHILT